MNPDEVAMVEFKAVPKMKTQLQEAEGATVGITACHGVDISTRERAIQKKTGRFVVFLIHSRKKMP